MKTAIIIAGVCRYTDISHKSWTMLPEADWYLSTWDISQKPFSDIATSSKNEIDNIKYLFKEIFVSSYKEEYMDTNYSAFERSFILLEKTLEHIKKLNYDRIIYFRPDLMLYSLENYSIDDLLVNDNYVNVLDIHDPLIVNNTHKQQQVSDIFFVFSNKTFLKYVVSRNKISNCNGDVHRTTYNFFVKNNIEIKILTNMKSCILRDNIYDNLNDLSWENTYKIFHKVFESNPEPNKFGKELQLPNDYPKDIILLERSKAGGGILKLRNK